MKKFKIIGIIKILKERKCEIIPFNYNSLTLKIIIKVIQLIYSFICTYFQVYINDLFLYYTVESSSFHAVGFIKTVVK